MDDYYIYVTTIQANAIKTLVEVLKDVLSDVNMVFDPSGIKVIAMDPTQISLVQLKLYSDKFEKYHCPTRRTLGLCMSSLFKLIKSVNNTDNITFAMKKTNTSELEISIENSDKNSKTLYHLKLLDLDEETLTFSNVEFDYSLVLPSNDFQRLCRDMQNLSDKLRIKVNNSVLMISCDGDFATQETSIGETTHGLIFQKKSDVIYEEVFSLKYINLFTKSTNLSNNIELSLKDKYPLVLKYSVANLGDIKFCLAGSIGDT